LTSSNPLCSCLPVKVWLYWPYNRKISHMVNIFDVIALK